MNNKVTAKILTLEEKKRFNASFITSFCFHTRFDNLEKRKIDWCDDETEQWGAFYNNELISIVYNNQYDCMFNNQVIHMSGIGGVSTLPEYRNLGGIREIMIGLLKDAYKKGDTLSCLSPFSTSFYRKFGYDVACYKNEYQFRATHLKEYHFNGEVIMFKEGMDITPFETLYNKYIENYNLSVVRSKESWQERIPCCDFKKRRFAYLFKQNNEYIAYLIFKDIYQPEEAKFEVEEVVFINKDGLNAILGFLSRFSSDYGQMVLPLPLDVELNNIINTPNCYSIEKETRIDYMVRAINVKKVLGLVTINNDTNFKIKVIDDIIEENNKTYLVTKDNIIETNELPDVECSITSFSQMIFGSMTISEFLLKDDVKVLTNINILKDLFNKKPLYITEEF